MTRKPPTTCSKGAINKAGRYIADVEYWVDPDHFDECINIVDSWRESHSYPMKMAAQTLRLRAKKADQEAIVSQRLKRLPSVIRKLQRKQTHEMQLARMNDMGGCRAVVSDMASLNELLSMLAEGRKKNPNRTFELVDIDNYIDDPKSDGYRSIHHIYRYRSEHEKTKAWNGYKVEVQIRTQLQHAWATAVETYDVISGEALKFAHNDSHGDPRWKRFFALASTLFAMKEDVAVVPGTTEDFGELINELMPLWQDLGVWRFFAGVNVAVNNMENWRADGSVEADQAILRLDSTKWEVTVERFTAGQTEKASARLLEIEKAHEPSIFAVLVRVSDLDKLRNAYPNYYADTSLFLESISDSLPDEKNESEQQDLFDA
jgi:ppGpp synthetase/RelA/SpoT-type nucleotidyltranferase